MSDFNPIAFVGPRDDGKVERISDPLQLPLDKNAYASALKFSTSLQRFTLFCEPAVYGGHDACVDVNNLCRNLDLHFGAMYPRGQFLATIKGGSQNIRLVGWMCSHGKVADVVIGDWSDQSHNPTTGVQLGITSIDGSPVTILVLKGDVPTLVPGTGPYKFLFPWPWLGPIRRLIVYGFETLRRWGLFRKEAN